MVDGEGLQNSKKFCNFFTMTQNLSFRYLFYNLQTFALSKLFVHVEYRAPVVFLIIVLLLQQRQQQFIVLCAFYRAQYNLFFFFVCGITALQGGTSSRKVILPPLLHPFRFFTDKKNLQKTEVKSCFPLRSACSQW